MSFGGRHECKHDFVNEEIPQGAFNMKGNKKIIGLFLHLKSL